MSGSVYALLTAVSWGVAVVLFRRSGERMSPLALNFHKNLLALVLFGVTLVGLRDSLWPPHAGEDLGALLASGFFGLAVADTLFFYSLNLLGAARSAVIDALYSPAVLVISYLYLGERLTPLQALGATLVVGGVLLTAGESGRDRTGSREAVLGAVLGGIAMALMAAAIVGIKPLLARHSVLWATSARMAGGVAGLVVFGLVRASWRRELIVALQPQAAWRYALPGSIVGTYVALLFWVAGFKYADASLAAILNQTSTLWIVVLAWLFLGERLSRRRLVAVTLAFVGSMLAVV